MKFRITLLVLFFFIWISPAFSTSFSSASETYFLEKGIIKGEADTGLLNEESLINRAELVSILVRHMGSELAHVESKNCFEDVKEEWFSSSVCLAKKLNWIKGSVLHGKTYFYPGNRVTLSESLVILQRFFDWPVIPGKTWYDGSLTFARNAFLVDPSLEADHQLKKKEALEIFFRSLAMDHAQSKSYDPFLGELFLQTIETKPSLLSDDALLGITVSLKDFPDQPLKASLPKGATHVPVLRFEFLSDSTLSLEEIAIKRISIGRSEDIEKTRLYLNGKFIDSARFFSDQNFVHFADLKTPLEAKMPLVAEIMVDFVKDAENNFFYQFEVNPTNILFSEKNVKVLGEPVKGPIYNIAALPADLITIANPLKKINRPFVNAEKQIISRLIIIPGGHDVTLKGIRLKNAGYLDQMKFENFRLSFGGKEIAFVKRFKDYTLDFVTGDQLIKKGTKAQLTVRADILDTKRSDALRLYLESPEDLFADDLMFGFGVRVKNEFSFEKSWCVGETSVQCPQKVLRKKCSKDEIKEKVDDCP